MSFLAPVWLLLGLAAAVPLLLHLLKRRVDLKVDFPAVRYLARAKQDNRQRLRVQNLLLMALRVLAVLLLATAAARPIGWLGGTGHVPTALAIVLDNSLSSSVVVDGAPLLEQLRAQARALVDAANSSDRLWLVTADGQVVGGETAVIRDAIDRVEVFPGQGDLPAAVTRAAGLVRAAQLQGEHVAVLTDAQATTWQRGASVGSVPLALHVPRGTALANRAVVLAEARPDRWTPNGSVVVRMAGWGPGGDSATYRVALGARTLARGTLRTGEEAIIRTAPGERGWQAGTVEIAPDELRADDTRHFAVWLGDAPRVRVDASAGAFVQTAVTALISNARAASGGAIEVTSAEAAARLPAVLLAPADPVRVGAANRALERLGVPWRFAARRSGESVARGDRMEGVSVTLRYVLEPSGVQPVDTMATVSGEPWIVAGERYVLIASPLTPEATTLPISAGFVPWLGDALAQRLSGEAGRVITAAPGSVLALPAGTTGLETVEGEVTPFDPSAPRAPLRAGTYFVRRGPVRVGAVTVNAEADEADLRRLDDAALAARLRGDDVLVLRDAERWRAAAFASGSRRPLGTVLLVLLLLVIAAETVLARSGIRRLRRA